MELKATVLCENYVMSNLGAIAEHGWAVYLELPTGIIFLIRGRVKDFWVMRENFKLTCQIFMGLSLVIIM